MKHIVFLLLFISAFVTTSCVDSDFSAGKSIINDPIHNVLVDTATVNLTTVLYDSTVTSGIGKIFLGKYKSSDFGNTEAESYMTFSSPNYSTADFRTDTKYRVQLDSVCLILTYDHYSYGDTTQTQTINVYRLADRLDEKLKQSNNLAFYSNQTAKAKSELFASKTFKRPQYKNPAANIGDSTLTLKLPNEFAQELMDSLKAQSKITLNETNFIKYFNGLKIAPGNDDKSCITAFKMTNTGGPVIRVYYHTYNSKPEEKTMDLRANTGYAFSHIVQDRSNTPLKDLTSSTGISSHFTGNKTYLQGMVGLYTQLTFPYVYNMLQYGKYTNVNAAYLYIYPLKETYNDFTPLPKSVSLEFVNKLGEVKKIYTTAVTSSISAGVLTHDPILVNRYFYAFDVTSFIQSEMPALGDSKGTLQLNLSSLDKANTLKSLIIGDSRYPDTNYRIKLVIQFLIQDYD